jgi:hypothetical protein
LNVLVCSGVALGDVIRRSLRGDCVEDFPTLFQSFLLEIFLGVVVWVDRRRRKNRISL